MVQQCDKNFPGRTGEASPFATPPEKRPRNDQEPGGVTISLTKGVRKGGGLKSPLELDILQNFITCAKEINCFRILFAC